MISKKSQAIVFQAVAIQAVEPSPNKTVNMTFFGIPKKPNEPSSWIFKPPLLSNGKLHHLILVSYSSFKKHFTQKLASMQHRWSKKCKN
jgi:hypothetical protein